MKAPRSQSDQDAANTTELTRLIGFSDAFFPIVITLLVIEIHRPEAPPGGLRHALLEAWPSYAAFGLAFVYVGVIWLNHHGLFRRVTRVDTGLQWINLGILGTAALIPFPTAVLAEALQGGNVEDQRAAILLYGVFAAMMSAAWIPLFPYLERHRQRLAPDVPPGYFAAQRSRPWVGVASYASAVGAGMFVAPWFGIAIFLLIVIYHAWTSDGLGSGGKGTEATSSEPVGIAAPAE